MTRHSEALLPELKRQTTGFHSPAGSNTLRHVSYFSFVVKLSRLDAVLQRDVEQNLAGRVGVFVRQAILKRQVVFLDVRSR